MSRPYEISACELPQEENIELLEMFLNQSKKSFKRLKNVSPEKPSNKFFYQSANTTSLAIRVMKNESYLPKDLSNNSRIAFLPASFKSRVPVQATCFFLIFGFDSAFQ